MYQEVLCFEAMFHEGTKPPTVLNDLDISTEEGRDAFNNRLMMLYKEENLSNIPRCDCEHLSSGQYFGDICDRCGTPCLQEYNKPISINHWLRIPDGAGAFITPLIFEMLDSYMTASQVSMLRYLCDPTMIVGEEIFWVGELRERGIPRGLHHFVERFDFIMEHVHEILKPKKKLDKRNEMRMMIAENRDKIFTRYLPLPNRIVFAIENNDYGRFADAQITLAINAIRAVVSADDGHGLLKRKRTVAKKEQMVTGAMRDLGLFYRYFMKYIAGDKPGLFRKNFYGNKNHFSARAVIVSQAARHRFETIKLSWSVMVQLFTLHIQAKLTIGVGGRPPMSIKAQERLIKHAALNYDAYIDYILEQLLAEAPQMSELREGTGIPTTCHRYPSLNRGSAQMLYIDGYSKDPKQNVIELSLLDLAAFNADFDGDEVTLMLITDNATAKLLSRLSPIFGVMDLNKPRTISTNVAIPKPLISTIDHFFVEEDRMIEDSIVQG